MKKTARRKTARRGFSMPVLFTAILLVFAGVIVAGGNGTPDHDLTDQENISSQIPDSVESAPSLSTPPSNQETDTSTQPESAPVPMESEPLPTPTPTPASTDPPVESAPQPTPTPTPTPTDPPIGSTP